MLGGALLHAGFSLRALQAADIDLPSTGPVGIVLPGDGDDRLREGLLALQAGQWPVARCSFLDVLEQHPGCLVAHAALGRLLADLEHRDTALLHLTAAVRLGLGALAHDPHLPLDASRETERALLAALVARAGVFASSGRKDDAVSDLRRALAWDPTDAAGAARPLARLLGDAPGAFPLAAEAS